MWTFFLRRLLAVPPLLVVISFLTYLLLQAAPGDFFSTLDADPKRSKDFVMSLRASAGKVVEVSPEERAERLSEFVVDGKRYAFDADGRLRKDGAPAEPREEQQSLKRFDGPDGKTWAVTPEGHVYRWVGTIHGYFTWLWNVAPKRILIEVDRKPPERDELGRVANPDAPPEWYAWYRVDHWNVDFGVNLGVSYQGQAPVVGLITERVSNTLILGIASLLLAWIVAIPLGVWSGVKPNSPVDHACGFVSYMSLSVPTVFLSLLGLLFAYSTKWFPVGDMHDVHHAELSWWGRVSDTSWHLFLPAIVIALAEVAIFMRQTRSQMVDTMSADYIRTARAKGVSHNRVIFIHALRNAINPLVTLFGFSLAALLSGEFLVEVVFNWPGLAQVTVNAVFQRDEPLVMASVLMAALLLVAGNLVADVLLAVVDPRIRLE